MMERTLISGVDVPFHLRPGHIAIDGTMVGARASMPRGISIETVV